jgi:AAA15 family ATPase/GTPase
MGYSLIFTVSLQLVHLKHARRMLIELRISNFKSFRDEAVFSMVPNKNGTDEDSGIIHDAKMPLSKIAAIYGPNASGKSNLIEAIAVMKKIIASSAQDKEPGRKDPSVVPFKLDEESSKQTSSFEAVFLYDGNRYQYGFTTTSEMIHEEWLYVCQDIRDKKVARSQTWFNRNTDPKTKQTDISFSDSYFKGDKAGLKAKTRPDALLVSVGAQWNNQQLTDVYEWFKNGLRVVKGDIHPQVTADRMLKSNTPEFSSFVTNMLKTADFGITDVTCSKIDPETIEFPENFSEEIKDEIRKNPLININTEFYHSTKYGSGTLKLSEESQGTQRFFALLTPLWDILHGEVTVFFDEFDRSMHTIMTKAFIKFICSEKNVSGQVIMSLHDTHFQKHLRRDQIWFTQKDKNGCSDLYSLSDFKGVRSTDDIQKRYLKGHYDAIPYIEDF